MSLSAHNEQQAIRAEARADNIAYAIERAGDNIAYDLDVMFDALCSGGCMPVGFTGSQFRNEVCKRAAIAAIRAALEDSRANLPREVAP